MLAVLGSYLIGTFGPDFVRPIHHSCVHSDNSFAPRRTAPHIAIAILILIPIFHPFAALEAAACPLILRCSRSVWSEFRVSCSFARSCKCFIFWTLIGLLVMGLSPA
jgi:hypothetical protein